MVQLSRPTLTIGFLLGFLAGVALGKLWTLTGLTALGAGAGLLLLGLLLRRWGAALLIALVLSGAALGVARWVTTQSELSPADLAYYNDNPEYLTLTGVVDDAPDVRLNHTKLTIAVESLALPDNEPIPVKGKLLIKTPLYPHYAYGDHLTLSAKIEKPFETEDFDYGEYLALKQIYSVSYYPSIERLAEGAESSLWAALIDLRLTVEDKLKSIYTEPAASLIVGLLTGSRQGIPRAVMDDFGTTGLTHIIAISGYNIALVIAFVTGLVGTRVRRQWQFPLVAVFVVLFTLFVGAGAPVVRAAIMGLLAFYGLTHGRQYHAGVGLAFTAALMVFLNPQILLADAAFQLSFAAVIGIIYVGPVLERLLAWVPNLLALRESLMLTLAAQITAVPLVILYFDQLSIISPIANILVAPVLPLAMLLGALTVLLAFVSLPLAIFVGLPAYLLLSYILLVARELADLPLASTSISQLTVVGVIAYYLLLIAALAYYYHRYHYESVLAVQSQPLQAKK